MNFNRKLFIVLFFCLSFAFGKEIILQNGSNYSGCEDTYLSAIFADAALTNMVSDSQTNHSAEDALHLSK